MRLKEIKYIKQCIKQLKHVNIPSHYEGELQKLHKRRPSSKLSEKTNLSIDFIRRCIATDQSYRSRIIYILFELKRTQEMVDALRNNLTVTMLLDTNVGKEYKTKTDKKIFVDNYVNILFQHHDEIYRIIDVANYIIEDIDKSAWALRELVKTFELTTRPELNL